MYHKAYFPRNSTNVTDALVCHPVLSYESKQSKYYFDQLTLLSNICDPLQQKVPHMSLLWYKYNSCINSQPMTSGSEMLSYSCYWLAN